LEAHEVENGKDLETTKNTKHTKVREMKLRRAHGTHGSRFGDRFPGIPCVPWAKGFRW
jgi:hypothetical protein